MHSLALIVSAVKEAGMMDETVFILSADHGGKGTGHGGKTMNEMQTPIVFWWVLSIPFFISCIRQQNPLTVLSKIILRKVKQFNLPPQKKNEGFLHF